MAGAQLSGCPFWHRGDKLQSRGLETGGESRHLVQGEVEEGPTSQGFFQPAPHSAGSLGQS